MVPTSRWRGFFLISLLTFFALAVHGYHPFAEDGGLYAAEIKHALNPALYGQSAFVTQHLPSVFALLVAGITRLTRLNLEWVLFLLYILTLWITLYAASTLVSRTTISFAGRYAAMALLACWLTLPIAGTSLMLFDPYLTARSLTTTAHSRRPRRFYSTHSRSAPPALARSCLSRSSQRLSCTR